MLIDHPLVKNRPYPIQQVLRDLAAQENCGGVPYDQMILAAAYIDRLEDLIDLYQNFDKRDD